MNSVLQRRSFLISVSRFNFTTPRFDFKSQVDYYRNYAI